jgi:hypothetical protein
MNKSSNKNIIIVVIVAITALVLVAGVFYWLGSNSKEAEKNAILPTPTKIMQASSPSKLYGYIFSSGINQTMVKYAKYQVTYLNTKENVIGADSLTDKFDGAFLLGKDSDIEKYWGQCVEVAGSLTNDVASGDLVDNYYRVFMNVDSITPSTKCTIEITANPNNTASKTFKGTIIKADRPEPDITYDYKLMLTTPYNDTENASGLEQKVTEIIITPASKEMFDAIRSNYNKKVTISGEWIWGFAESKFFLVSSIK